MKSITLLAGTPTSGKTSFGDYLRDKKHFLHVDMEAFQGSYFHTIWEAALNLRNLSLFLNALKEHSVRTVLSWGFHPDNANIVTELKRLGVDLWWFEADEAAAREKFKARGYGSIGAFEAQIKRIRDSRATIEGLFAPNMLTTLRADSSTMTFAEIFAAIDARAQPD